MYGYVVRYVKDSRKVWLAAFEGTRGLKDANEFAQMRKDLYPMYEVEITWEEL